ncbi:MAG: hypothetical protein IPG25_10625 [Proteobacteria bacterium]|nr:hypothetical protein [Pseudomonadota bacterium]
MTARIANCLLPLSLILLIAPTFAADQSDATVRRGYVDGRFGQMHYYIVTPAGATPKHAPIVFFHQNPKSGVEYEFLLSDLGRDRVAIAIDTPGYGGSDRPRCHQPWSKSPVRWLTRLRHWVTGIP